MEIPGFVKTIEPPLWMNFKYTGLDIPVLARRWLKELYAMILRLIFWLMSWEA